MSEFTATEGRYVEGLQKRIVELETKLKIAYMDVNQAEGDKEAAEAKFAAEWYAREKAAHQKTNINNDLTSQEGKRVLCSRNEFIKELEIQLIDEKDRRHAYESHLEKAEAELINTKVKLEEEKNWSATLITERDNYKIERDRLRKTFNAPADENICLNCGSLTPCKLHREETADEPSGKWPGSPCTFDIPALAEMRERAEKAETRVKMRDKLLINANRKGRDTLKLFIRAEKAEAKQKELEACRVLGQKGYELIKQRAELAEAELAKSNKILHATAYTVRCILSEYEHEIDDLIRDMGQPL